ncbi:MAG: hypothetical protein EON60_13620 [Alphaproteobacteria bacterium]|nr:MAG: hypothetical protein EON60_13620 [Alphaproteobacteria bacterium]
MMRWMIACMAALAMLTTLPGQPRAADDLPYLNLDELFRMVQPEPGYAPQPTKLCDMRRAWWAQPGASEWSPMPPAYKLAAAILECRFKCRPNTYGSTALCPSKPGEADFAQRVVTHGISVRSIGAQATPVQMPVGIRDMVNCGPESLSFDARKLRLELHRQCSVNGSVQSIRFWIEYPDDGEAT